MVIRLLTAALVAFAVENRAGVETNGPDHSLTGRCYAGASDNRHYIGDRRCIRFDGPRRFAGVWVAGVESSLFFPKAGRLTDVRPVADQIWLSIDQRSALLPGFKIKERHAYLVTFVGQPAHDMHRAAPLEGYGWIQAASMVLVDRFTSIRDLGPVRDEFGFPKITVLESPPTPDAR